MVQAIRVERSMGAGRKQVRTAKDVLERMAVNAQRSSTSVTPFGALNDLIRRNAETVMAPDHCDAIVEELLASSKEVWPADDAAKVLGTPDVAGALFHPYFLRAAARRGCVFYVAADGTVHRHSFTGVTKPGLPVLDGPVDPGFYVEPVWYSTLESFVKRGSSVLIIGPAGCGKSEAVSRVFTGRKQELQIISCTPAMSSDDFEGKFDLRGGSLHFSYSPAAIAVRDGHGLLLDDVDAAPAEACYSLYRALIGADMRISRLGAEGVLHRHRDFRCVATQNTEGRGDDRGLYHGRSHQDEAFLDRWTNYIRADYPPPETEALILNRRTGLPKKHAEKIIKVAVELRKGLAADRLMVTVTLRRALAVAENVAAGFTPEDAWKFAVQNRATAEDVQVISDLVNRVYGSAAKKPVS